MAVPDKEPVCADTLQGEVRPFLVLCIGTHSTIVGGQLRREDMREGRQVQSHRAAVGLQLELFWESGRSCCCCLQKT